MSKTPRAGSKAWEEQLRQDPAYVRETILQLAQEAKGGSKLAIERLLDWLKRYPDMRSLVRSLDDLSIKVERVWIERLSGTDALTKKALEDELAAMKAELLGANSSVTDRMLASTVLVAHLGFQHAALAAAISTDKLEVRSVRARLLSVVGCAEATPGCNQRLGVTDREKGTGHSTSGQAEAIRVRRSRVTRSVRDLAPLVTCCKPELRSDAHTITDVGVGGASRPGTKYPGSLRTRRCVERHRDFDSPHRCFNSNASGSSSKPYALAVLRPSRIIASRSTHR